MADLPEIVKRATTLHTAIAADLYAFGGILRCGQCGHEQQLGDIAAGLRGEGWPQCCGQTMTWVTQSELARESREVPEGFELVAVEAGPEWRADPDRRPCRLAPGRGTKACGKPSVVILMRGERRNQPWSYCPAHLYGRWVEDGKVMNWILRAKEEAR